MKWLDWKKSYLEIANQLGISIKKDEEASYWLEEYFYEISKTRRAQIEQKLFYFFQQPIIIAGAGPSLEYDLSQVIALNISIEFPIIAVNGATSLFKLKKIVPKVVVSDLDGDLEAIRWAIESGSLVLIHAHGDNQQQVSIFLRENYDIVSKFNVWGTTQCEPKHTLFNFGGFTDGDRAIFMAFHFQSPLIGLIGFDFGSKIGYYSLLNSPVEKNEKFKLKKFRIALDLIAKYYLTHKGIRYNLTSHGRNITGFPKEKIPVFLNKMVQYYK